MNDLLPLSSLQLKMCFPNASQKRVDHCVDAINRTLLEYGANTPRRCSYFLAQIGHESGELLYTEEIASGAAYEGRLDLGNTQPGDGKKYKGRGLIQVTGKSNYILCGLALDLPLLENPELLSSMPYAALSAGWFFSNNNLWPLCDSGNFRILSYRINGGKEPKDPNGWADRLRLLKNCEQVLGIGQ